MGTWGDGIFESDQALDFLAQCTQELEWYIQNCLYRMYTDADEYYEVWGDGLFIQVVYMLWILVNESKAVPPDPRIVKHWKQQYFDWHTEVVTQAELEAKPDYFSQRKDLMVKLFDSLLAHGDRHQKIENHNSVGEIPLLESGGEWFVWYHVEHLITHIQSIFYEEDNDIDLVDSWREYESIVVAVHILWLFAVYCRLKPPKPNIILKWKQRHLALLAETDYADLSEYIPNCAKEFDKLIQVSEDYQKRVQQEIAERRNEQKGKD